MNAWSSTAAIPVIGVGLAPGAAALAGAVGLAQIAAVASAEPQQPSFADGGIVPGSSFSGDNVRANVNSGEMVLTMQDQKSLLAMIRGGNGIGMTSTINIELDGVQVAKNTVKLVDNGVVKMRSLAR